LLLSGIADQIGNGRGGTPGRFPGLPRPFCRGGGVGGGGIATAIVTVHETENVNQ